MGGDSLLLFRLDQKDCVYFWILLVVKEPEQPQPVLIRMSRRVMSLKTKSGRVNLRGNLTACNT